MADPVIHIVGPAVRIGTRLRQRCAWCGVAIVDEDLSLWASSDGNGFMPWPVGKLLEVGESFKCVVANGPTEPLPVRCCAGQRKLSVVPKGGDGG